MSDPVERSQGDAALDCLPKALDEVAAMRLELTWYGEKASALRRYLCSTPPNTIAAMSVVDALQIDNGNRARKFGLEIP